MTNLSRRLVRLEQRIAPARALRHHIVLGDNPEPADVGPDDTVHRIIFVDAPSSEPERVSE